MEIKDFVKKYEKELFELLKELCLIPAPSYKEDARAEFCKKWLCDIGADGVYIDKAKNVIFPMNCEGKKDITVVVAHTDTVFPDLEPMPYKEEEGKIFCPGVGDDTASLAVMMMCVKYMIENSIVPEDGILFVCNSCEEGLGNLYGTRTVMDEYKGRVKQFISFDSNIDHIADRCVGSHRYKVKFITPGGHSYLEFPGRSAILAAAEVINKIYSVKLPEKQGEKTTLNVGIVEGGTSVNTIAQSAAILCEYRSTDVECLSYMKKEFFAIFDEANNMPDTRVEVECVGERPCADKLDMEKQNALAKRCKAVIEGVAGVEVGFKSSSTDCNIPLSLGIPAVCVGVYTGGKVHTREEFIYRDSLPVGLEVGISVLLDLIK